MMMMVLPKKVRVYKIEMKTERKIPVEDNLRSPPK
jgi:hypothetical protein